MWWRMVLKEMLRRKWGLLFSVAAIAVAIASLALIVAVTTSLNEEARIIGVQMRQNILILPADVPLDDLHRAEFGDAKLPESLFSAVADKDTCVMVDLTTLAHRNELTRTAEARKLQKEKGENKVIIYTIPELADHYAAELQQKARASAGGRSMNVILTGQRKEQGLKKPIDLPAQPGTAKLGAAVAEQLRIKQGDAIQIAGETLKVASVEPSQGTSDDIRVYVALADAQRLLNRPGQINRVIALGCLCHQLTISRLAELLENHINAWSEKHRDSGQAQSAPDRVSAGQTGAAAAHVRVIPMERLARARESMRRMIGSVGQWLAPIFAIICGALVCGYFYFNVRERRQEMGVLLAIGYTPGPIVLAVLFKLAVVSLLGGVLGTLGGLALAIRLGPMFGLTHVLWPATVWLQTMGLAVALTVLAGVYPLLLAWRVRAADILRNA